MPEYLCDGLYARFEGETIWLSKGPRVAHGAEMAIEPMTLMALVDYARRGCGIRREQRAERALQNITSWADTFPLAAFPEPDVADLAKADALLQAGGITLDTITGAVVRHMVREISRARVS